MSNKLKINIISESVNTVQGHGVHTAFEEHVASLNKRSDTEVYINAKVDADIVHIHTVGIIALKHLLLDKGKKFVSAHVVPDSFIGSLRGAKYWYGFSRTYLRWFYNQADGVFAVSQEVVDQLEKMGVKKPIYLVPNTIDTSLYKTSPIKKILARKKLRISQDKFVVICNGQVQPRKRVDTFIDCAKKLPNIEFIWIGGIPFKNLASNYKTMQNRMKNHPKNVRFTGIIKHEEVYDYYFAGDLFFLPSVQETFGIVIVEAAAASLPIILRNNQQYKKTFNGWYQPGNESSFRSLILKFKNDKSYYNKMRSKSLKIAKKYDSAKGAERIMKIYRKNLEKAQ